MNQVKLLAKEVEKGNKERATLKEALAIKLNSHASHSVRESPRVPRPAVDTSPTTRTLLRGRE